MMQSFLLAAARPVENQIAPWFSSGTPLIMSICCLLAVVIASRVVQRPDVGPMLPLGPLKMSVPTFIGAMSFGHLLGTLAVLTLAR